MAKNKETNKKNQAEQDAINKTGNNNASNNQTQSGVKDHCGGSNSNTGNNGYSSKKD